MNEKIIRNIFYFKNYYLDFFEQLKPEVKRKFNWTLQLIATIDRVPSKFFSHMEGTEGIYEIRVEVGSDIYRVFSFFDKGQLVILVNGFQKKSQKTPKREIELAEKLKKQYFDEKESD
ncbi:MAG: type II toxin-antitoxin system RelE/ParE family toxin [Bacteroidales bacterium]|nr:MAG: type II toxin-antitoxin system RelE/ParE family toxin [Bacteroidales bacterium]